MSDEDVLDRRRLLAFLRIIGVESATAPAFFAEIPELLQLAPEEFAHLPVSSEVINREGVLDAVYLQKDLSRETQVAAASRALTLVARRQWEGPLLRLLLFCTGWAEERARDAAASLDANLDDELAPVARAWLDVIDRKTVAQN